MTDDHDDNNYNERQRKGTKRGNRKKKDYIKYK